MKKNIASFAVSVIAVAAFAMPQVASASLVYDSTIDASGLGFGSAPRTLTLQWTGNPNSDDAFESGSVTVNSSGQIELGAAISDASVFAGNGVANSSSTAAMPPLGNPQTTNKYGIPTIGSLGITQASQIAVLFNATESQNNASINVTDLTLKFFDSAGGFLGAIDGQQSFADTFAGNGVAGYTFVIDVAQQAEVNPWLALGGAGTIMALEASITDFSGGPESFLIYNRTDGGGPPITVPEPTTLLLMSAGLFGFGLARRRKSA